MGGHGWVVWEDETGDEDVGVGGSSAFGSDDVGIVLGSYLVYDSDETFVPAVLVVLSLRAIC